MGREWLSHLSDLSDLTTVTWTICCLCSTSNSACVKFLVRLCSSWTWYDWLDLKSGYIRIPNIQVDVSQVWQPHFSSEVVWFHRYTSAHGPPPAGLGRSARTPPRPQSLSTRLWFTTSAQFAFSWHLLNLLNSCRQLVRLDRHSDCRMWDFVTQTVPWFVFFSISSMEFMLFNACHTALHSRYYTHVKSHGMVFDQWEVCSVASNRCVDVQLCFCFFYRYLLYYC